MLREHAPTEEMVVTKMPSWSSWRARTWFCLIAFLLSSLTAYANPDEVLEYAGFKLPEGTDADKWKTLQSAIEEEHEVITACRSDLTTCPSAAARRFVAIVDEGMQHDGKARIGHINRAANLAIRATKKYVEQWTSPLQTLANGVGDCKQYAVLKYVALNEAGYRADRLRILVVEDKVTRWSHAVVAVSSHGQWMVLDNRSNVLIEGADFLKQYTRVAVLPPLLQFGLALKDK
jgi:predicted transglutaminase-like cysteine proteinase